MERYQWEENRRKREKHRAGVCVCIALVMAAILTTALLRERGVLVEARAEQAKEGLAEEVLRFHVLANSDSEQDQALKMKVKEAVLDYMKENMEKPGKVEAVEVSAQVDKADATKAWAQRHLDEIEEVAGKTLSEEGSPYTVEAEIGFTDFPEKTYGDITFPAGTYEALRVKIGEAKGQNWWCCLYPNLCFTDAVHAVVPEEGKEELKEVLTVDEYEMITATSDYKIKWFFLGEDTKEN